MRIEYGIYPEDDFVSDFEAVPVKLLVFIKSMGFEASILSISSSKAWPAEL